MNFDSLIPRVLETVIAEATDVGVTPFLYEDDDYMIGGRAAVDGDIEMVFFKIAIDLAEDDDIKQWHENCKQKPI